MNKKPRKSLLGPLSIVLLVILVVSFIIEWLPLHYEHIVSDISSQQFGITIGEKAEIRGDDTWIVTGEDSSMNYSGNISSQQSDIFTDEKVEALNADIRASMKKGGSIGFHYNYIPSTRSWDTMYSYVLYRYSSSGDCTFYCTRYTLDKGSEDLCHCLYSEVIWNDLISLILDSGKLVDCTSMYDSSGRVANTPVEKTISLANGVYAPDNIDDIEAYFKKLAITAGADASDLNKNIPVDDANIVDKKNITDLNGSFVYNPIGGISNEEKQHLETYLRSKYEETGIRMYIILYSTDDTEAIMQTAEKMLNRATSPAMAYGITASGRSWVFRYKMDPNHESSLRDGYTQVADAYQTGITYYDKLMNAINKAYELY